jgi:lactate permease
LCRTWIRCIARSQHARRTRAHRALARAARRDANAGLAGGDHWRGHHDHHGDRNLARAGERAITAWAIGAGTGLWAIDWITFWGVVIYNTLVETGAFEDFKRWLISQATADVRVQTILLAWSLGALLLLLKFWRPSQTLGFGGIPVEQATAPGLSPASNPGPASSPPAHGPGPAASPPGTRAALRGLMPFAILIAVVVAATGPWSHLATYHFAKPGITAVSSLSHKTSAITFDFAPAVAGTWILVSLILIIVALRAKASQATAALHRSFSQMWGALLAAPIIFGLAQVFNYSGMANTLAHGFSRVGAWFILLSPILGWIGVALSGSNTSTNALLGGFQYSVGRLLNMPILLLPSLNSAGAEVGKPVAPQTASVGVSTSHYVRREGDVIRHNMGWTLVMLAYLILIGLFYRYLAPAAMRL